ncbi:MAG: hypothetical protein ACNA78_02330 [Balneolaceae bacterium]
MICATLWLHHQASAQSFQQEKTVQVATADTTFFIDFLVDESSLELSVQNSALDPDVWSFDASTGRLNLTGADQIQPLPFDLLIRYRRLIGEISPRFQLRERQEAEADTTADRSGEDVVRTRTTADDLFGDVNLNQSGSLTRGFTIGNRQDLTLDSGLRLDLSGNLTDDITILATLTDRNTPIQPDGSTQNLREFDRVFIQLQAPVGTLELGDVDIQLDQSRFARINRRVQGASATAVTSVGDFGAGFSVSRGEFRLQEIQGIEGVQGPYRLTGTGNEPFIIVLAGSETVYIDGQQVNRGAENEYIIDYSLGEITFTNNLVITDDIRITVEYQFLTQQFTRTLVTAEAMEDQLLGGRLSVGASFIRESDSDNPNTQLNLTPEEIERLRDVTGSDELLVSGADSVGFQQNADFLLYARVDTVVNGETFEIFRHIPGDSRGVFRVRFTNFGEENGSYRRIGGTANGILFEWVGPGQGSYEPVIRLQAPQRKQMVALQSSLALTQNLRLNGEWAVSDFDRNLFSRDGTSVTDQSAFGELVLEEARTAIGTLDAGVRQQYIGRRFEFFDRQREIEFDRKWNIVASDRDEEEFETEGFLNLRPTEATTLRLQGGLLSRDLFDGRRVQLSGSTAEPGAPRLSLRTEWIDSDERALQQEGSWFRQQADAAYTFPVGSVQVTPFTAWETETRRQRSVADSLLPSSLRFYDINPGVRLQVGMVTLEGGIGYRENQRPFQNSLLRESVSRSQRFALEFRPSSAFRSENRLQFRQKQVAEEFTAEAASPRSRGVLIRSANNYRVGGDWLEGELLYEANTERRALLQETFIEVGPELGQFVWNDLNNDGVQQLDEFFPEVNPNEGTFIRQFIPSDELFPVIDLRVRSRNRIALGQLLGDLLDRDSDSLNRLVWTSLIDVQETSTEENLRRIYLLQGSAFRNEETTINGRLNIQQQMEWENEARTRDLFVSYTELRALVQRAAGFERRQNRAVELMPGAQLSERVRGTIRTAYRWNRTDNSRFASRSFDIEGFEAEPSFNLFINRSTQTEFRFFYSEKENRAPLGGATATTWRVENQSRLFLFNRLQNTIRLQLQQVSINGSPNSQAEFELTEGLGRGTNVLWSLNSNYRAGSLLRLSLQYNGRTTTTGEIIQTMRFVVSAVF